jgi:hypothetical protein
MGQDRKINFIEIRRAICNTCEEMTEFIGIQTCNKCGCAIWGKTMLSGQQCPMGKWNKHEN